MLSSTYRELVEHRRAVNEALVARGMLPLAMDFDAALPGHDLISASLSKVDAADAHVGMISYRYGQIIEESDRNPDQLSLTELEFRRAVKRRIPICMFIMHDDHPVPRGAVGKERGTEKKLEDFIALARKDRIYAEFTSVDDVKAKAAQLLVDLRRVLDRRDGVSGPGGEVLGGSIHPQTSRSTCRTTFSGATMRCQRSTTCWRRRMGVPLSRRFTACAGSARPRSPPLMRKGTPSTIAPHGGSGHRRATRCALISSA